jgi:uncharacterized membrane protein YhaH (DUF805 family)
MFKNPFSFEGRIRRTEYGLSFIIFAVGRVMSQLIAVGIAGNDKNLQGAMVFSYILLIPLLWFFWAQGSKRCHDVGISGWWQIVPFVPLFLLFGGGEKGSNRFGDDPKESQGSRDNF